MAPIALDRNEEILTDPRQLLGHVDLSLRHEATSILVRSERSPSETHLRAVVSVQPSCVAMSGYPSPSTTRSRTASA
jgi:hypothetical protein